MSDLAALERRISAALDRIARRMEAGAPGAAGADGGAGAPPGELARLRQALEKERSSNAQLSERVHQIKQRQDSSVTQLERRLARLTEQLDLQSLEMLRLKKANAKLMEANASLRDAREEGAPESKLVNRSIAAELEALQAERRTEMAEMEEILAELKPLLAAERHGG